jgi:hypothetical protein
MARKKSSTDSEAIEGIAEINDGEQLVEETTRKVRRERVAKSETPALEIEDNDVIDAEIEPEDDAPRYSETSLAAKLFAGDDGDSFGSQFCTVNVRRTPDGANDRFATPNSANANLAPFRNIDITTEQADIEDMVRREYGGGHYFFQLHFNGQLGPSWKSTLADLPEHMRVKPAPLDSAAVVSPPSVPQVDPLESMINQAAKTKQLADLLFGDERNRLERQIEELKREIDSKPADPVEPKSETLQILERALASNNPTLQDKLLEYAFPADSGGSSHWIPDLVKTLFEHKSEVGGLLQMVFGGVAPQQPSIEQLMRAAPPLPPADAEKQSTFRRQRTKPVTTEDAETDAK